jgi:hypothetical protein
MSKDRNEFEQRLRDLFAGINSKLKEAEQIAARLVKWRAEGQELSDLVNEWINDVSQREQQVRDAVNDYFESVGEDPADWWKLGRPDDDE